jgi:hypothetical protein
MTGTLLSRGIGMTSIPTIVPLRSEITAEQLEALCPGDGVIYACDFYVTGAEKWKPEAGGLRSDRILNVDHHAPLERMDSPMTSTRLAAEHVRTAGIAEPGSHVVINHTDCDSVLSSAIMLGVLPSHDVLVEASVCADHTGKRNDIADLLQALDELRKGDRTAEQYAESVRNLRMLLETGEVLDPVAAVAVAMREQKRDAARALLDDFQHAEGVAFVECTREIDGAFFAHALEDAVVIMVAVPDALAPGNFVVKLRRGSAAPRGFSLHALEIGEWDDNYGGRTNAGSNKRGGGTTMPPAEYAERLRSRLREVLDDPMR